MSPLVRKYIEIFSREPWNESWTPEEARQKIEKDFCGNGAFLAVSFKNDEVLGFAWGKLLKVGEIYDRIKRSLPIDKEINFSLPRKMMVIYFDETAVDREKRRGLLSFRHLINVGLDYGKENGAEKVIFWSTPQSSIVPITKKFGYEEIERLSLPENEIVFLLGEIIRSKAEA